MFQSSHSFYDGDNVEFYYSRRRSMDDLSVLSVSDDEEEDCNDAVQDLAVKAVRFVQPRSSEA